jgi:hypothetical protein
MIMPAMNCGNAFGSRIRRNEPITIQEANGVLSATYQDSTVWGLRDTCIIIMMVSFGLSVKQLIALDICNYDPQAGTLLVASPKPTSIHLRTPVQSALNRWIEARGLEAGPLFNRILWPHNISPKLLQENAIIKLLNKRTRRAGLRPFSPSDVASTHSLLTSGEWNSAATPTIELFCLTEQCDSTMGRLILSFTPNPLLTKVAGDEASRLLVRFLTQYKPSRRAVLKHNLDLLANELSANLRDSATFDWCSINPSRLPSRESLALRFGIRQANAMRTTFHGLLRVGLRLGVFDEPTYDNFRKALMG